MTESTTDRSSLPATIFTFLGVAALAAVTLASPGATRMHSTPWNVVAAVALLAPGVVLLSRVSVYRTPSARGVVFLPPTPWTTALLVLVTVILISALASPYRAQAVLWSAPLIAGIVAWFAVHDWVVRRGSALGVTGEDFPERGLPERRPVNGRPTSSIDPRWTVVRMVAWLLTAAVVVGVVLWLIEVPAHLAAGDLAAFRNGFPLGHSNYAAGLALLQIPAALALVAQPASAHASPGFAGQASGRPTRWLWILAAIAGLALLVSSGSRGGFLGFLALALVWVFPVARRLRIRRWMVLVGVLLLVATAPFVNPRLRTLAVPTAASEESNLQRISMFQGGLKLGAARPALGWGPGTTPLAYPRFRAQVPGGVENVLQLHSTPVQVWAELGLAGLLATAAVVGLAIRAACGKPRSPWTLPVLGSLAGYAVFSLTDWQLDVPIFSMALGAVGALLTPAGAGLAAARLDAKAVRPLPVIGALLVVFAVFAVFARKDPTPELNAAALGAPPAEARVLLERSLTLNPDQELAHFNLGWLLVTEDPARASRHFIAAARLVPDKGGVYLGLGFARLNEGRGDAAAAALALEALNDPLFLTAPWWKLPEFSALRTPATAHLSRLAALAAERHPEASERVLLDLRYVPALARWLDGDLQSREMLGLVRSSARVDFFSKRLPLPDFASAPAAGYRRERTGYPILMRNLDIPAPVDLYDVRENSLAAGQYRPLFPSKGWLPSPILGELLDDVIQR